MSTKIGETITVEACLASAGLPRTIVDCRRGKVVFSEGDEADSIIYVLNGIVTLSVSGPRNAVVGVLGSGDFFGQECLAGQATRKRTATAMMRSRLLVIDRTAMVRLLHTERAFADRFTTHLILRVMRVEEDLLDQFLSSGEQRLARTLLILSGYSHRGTRNTIVPNISQSTLADIVGTTRAQINRFLQKFKTLGLIEMDGALTVHRSLLDAVSPYLRRSLRNRTRKRLRP
jgi:CRP/FNR family cyclic AMP-dependent transcriptional regulator